MKGTEKVSVLFIANILGSRQMDPINKALNVPHGQRV